MVIAVDIKADGMAPAPPGTAADLKGWLDLYRLRNQVEGKSLKTTRESLNKLPFTRYNCSNNLVKGELEE